MAETGLDAYRFSISWSRLIPDGRGRVNPKGLEYYNNLINELINRGIKPHVTLMHLDTPQALEEEYGGFINARIIEDFTAYDNVCFREFGDRVLNWTTINEANVFVLGGYDNGVSPPGRCSNPFGLYCTKGDSTTEPYLAAHNILLAHASAVSLYKEKYQAKQLGQIGFSFYTYHYIPSTDSTEDVIATQRAREFSVGCVFIDYNYTSDSPTEVTTFPNIPWALEGLLEYFKDVYNNPPIYIYENGQVTEHRTTVYDLSRVEYLQTHIGGVLDAVRNGSNTKGYFVWSFVDLFEVLYGYKYSFGLYYVDFHDPKRTTYAKLSQRWYSAFLNGKNVTVNDEGNQPRKRSTILGTTLDSDDRLSSY
ncbi:beta-glucosidase 3-like [Chenopodium quinoa]|uniref:beta-glucosidase 3-like n=1 Tax=Chenopodium quinoa TaxID=63459 RepID=UPI000B78CDD5|nr:beta-glucosidase 3-like [Chenopodium quinoa]